MALFVELGKARKKRCSMLILTVVEGKGPSWYTRKINDSFSTSMKAKKNHIFSYVFFPGQNDSGQKCFRAHKGNLGIL